MSWNWFEMGGYFGGYISFSVVKKYTISVLSVILQAMKMCDLAWGCGYRIDIGYSCSNTMDNEQG